MSEKREECERREVIKPDGSSGSLSLLRRAKVHGQELHVARRTG